MKLLHVIHSVKASAGGTIESLKQTSLIMSELGVDLEIVSLDAPENVSEEREAFPWKLHALGPGSLGVYSYSSSMLKWMQQHVCEFDAVIIHGNWQYHGLATFKACTANHVPYFIYPHGMLDPWFNKTYPLKKLKKQLYWNIGEHRVLKHAEAVLFTCTEECELARQSFSPYQVREKTIGIGTKAPTESIDTLKEGLQATNYPFRASPYFIFMSRIQEKKGLDLLVEAYATIRKEVASIPELVIAGPEQQVDYASKLKAQFPQDGIHWIGEVRGIEKWQLLAGAEAMTLTSHQENFGIVVAEALAVGTPTLITNKVNIFREIEQAHAGLVENDDLEGACKLLRKWLSLADADKDKMSTAAEKTFRTHFDSHRSTQNLIQFISESIDSHA